MQTYLKTKPAWIQLLLFLGMAFGIFIVFSFIGIFILSKMTGINVLEFQNVENWDASKPNMIIYIRGMLLIQFLSLFLIPSLLFSYFADPKPMHFIGLKKPSNAIYWVLGILVLLVAIPFVDFVGLVNQKLPFGGAQSWMKSMEEEASKQIQFMLSKHTPSELILNLVFIAVFAGVGEELFFRGILQRIFIRLTNNPWYGIIITAAIFSAFHFQFFGFLPRFLLGILLGAVYWYSGSLWTAILSHFIYDGLMIVIIYLNPEMVKNLDATIMQQSNLQLIVTALLSLVFTILIVLHMKKKSTAQYAVVYKDDKPSPDEMRF